MFKPNPALDHLCRFLINVSGWTLADIEEYLGELKPSLTTAERHSIAAHLPRIPHTLDGLQRGIISETGMTILVVDDEPFLAELVQGVLEAQGHRCVLARSAAEADAVLAAKAVDGMVLDLHMPGRNGLEWLEEIALLRPELARRTLVITGSDLSAEAYARTRQCGADLLPKPFSIEQLVDAVSRRGRVTLHDIKRPGQKTPDAEP